MHPGKQSVSVSKKINFYLKNDMASFLKLFTFDSYYPASEKQLEPMKTVIFTDVRQMLNLGMEA